MSGGGVNQVYRVDTEKGPVIVKVFGNRFWPEDDKPGWVERRLQRHKIPHAAILYHSRDDFYFPYGLMISQYVEGENAFEAVGRRRLSFRRYFAELGAALRSVHRISLRRYGQVRRGRGMYGTLCEFELTHQVTKRLREIECPAALRDRLYAAIERKLERQLAPFEKKLRPVLTHQDATPFNAVWTPDERLILVDWDNSLSSAWITDLAVLTFWSLYRNSSAQAGLSQTERLRDAFFSGYGEVDFGPDELALMENAIHAVRALDLLPYLQKTGDRAAFLETRDLLMYLLSR